MQSTKKRIMSLILAVAMILSLVPVKAFAVTVSYYDENEVL